MVLVATEHVPEGPLVAFRELVAAQFHVELETVRVHLRSNDAPSWVQVLADSPWWQLAFGTAAAQYVAELIKEAARETWTARASAIGALVDATNHLRRFVAQVTKLQRELPAETRVSLGLSDPEGFAEVSFALSLDETHRCELSVALVVHHMRELMGLIQSHHAKDIHPPTGYSAQLDPDGSLRVRWHNPVSRAGECAVFPLSAALTLGQIPDDPTTPAEAPLASSNASPYRYDIFISHASEDKRAVARPLYDELTNRGLRVWFAEVELQLGDSLSQHIDRALARCRYGVVILSPQFLAKKWPRRELDGLVARETHSGEKAILPIWHDLARETLLEHSPTLADRLAAHSTEGIDAIADQICRVLHKASAGGTQGGAEELIPELSDEEAVILGRIAAGPSIEVGHLHRMSWEVAGLGFNSALFRLCSLGLVEEREMTDLGPGDYQKLLHYRATTAGRGWVVKNGSRVSALLSRKEPEPDIPF
jgi:hypothetical protein